GIANSNPCSVMADASRRQANEFSQAATYLASIDGQYDKLCEYGNKTGIPMLTRLLHEWEGLQGNSCFPELGRAVLAGKRKDLAKYREQVADDCRKAAEARSTPPSRPPIKSDPSQSPTQQSSPAASNKSNPQVSALPKSASCSDITGTGDTSSAPTAQDCKDA